MELEKIRNLNDDELKSQQAKSAEELFRLRFRKSLGNNEGIKKLRGLKTDIARIKTIARERELHIARAAKPAKAASAVSESKPAAKKAAAKTAAKKTAAKKSAPKKAKKD